MKIKAHTFITGSNVTVCGKMYDPGVVDLLNQQLAEHPEKHVWCETCGHPVTDFGDLPDHADDPRCEADTHDGVCLSRLPSWDSPCPNEFIHSVVAR